VAAKLSYKIGSGQVIFLDFNSGNVTNIAPVRALAQLQALKIIGNNDLGKSKNLEDLSPLQGLPLRSLHCGWSSVRDLAPLRGMPLEELTIYYRNL
jgi:hypothetical protein